MKTKLILLSLFFFTGCALYGELYIEDGASGGWIGHEYEPCYGCDPTLYVEIDWNINHQTWPNCGDLDLELITPYGEKVTATRYDIAGCLHLGNDRGEGGYGSEMIICDFPDFGGYDIRVINRSEAEAFATLNVDYDYKGFTRDFWMTGFELRSFPISIR